jgi:hypothetical protein
MVRLAEARRPGAATETWTAWLTTPPGFRTVEVHVLARGF